MVTMNQQFALTNAYDSFCLNDTKDGTKKPPSTKINPNKPLVAKISLWTTRTNLNHPSNTDGDSDSSGDESDHEADFEMDDNAQLEQRLKQANLPEYVRKVIAKELQKLKKTPSFMSDYGVTRSYLELIADLPWNEQTPENIDLKKSRKDLDSNHYGMQKLKERVLEYLAVKKLKQQQPAPSNHQRANNNNIESRNSQPILLFVGPPGTGKTSIAQSIASSLNRKFQRISLGGVADQSTIRGHRRTYIGAMPGRIIQGIKAAGVNNPVFLLDEIDKMSTSYQGDPSSALLEVLDPEQNNSFTDHYLNLAFDLSNVMFIATANSLDSIPWALLDRMEVIRISDYTHEEKLNIAFKHLIPKQVIENGLEPYMIQFREDAISKIISNYAREAGVRDLERRLAAICRIVAVRVVEPQAIASNIKGNSSSGSNLTTCNSHFTLPVVIDAASIESYLGPMVYERENSRASVPGVAIGLVWTAVGGEIMFVEAEIVHGVSSDVGPNKREGLVLTGQLGSVMRESAMLALNWTRANYHRYDWSLSSAGYDRSTKTNRDLNENTIHIHFPAGAVCKDGPSAGVTIVVSLMSLCSGVSAIPDLAMTGEITLRGLVLRVGGIKSKVLAAYRAGIRKIILPAKNEPDLVDISASIKDKIKFYFVMNIDEVIKIAFDGKLKLRTVTATEVPGVSISVDPSRALTSKL